MIQDEIILNIEDTNRELITPNRMAIKNCVLTEAIVNQYLGKEIKNYKESQLEPEKLYNVYRPLEELEKALNQYNGLDVVNEHHVINGEKINRHYTIGATGESATIENYKLFNTVFITDKEAIRDINMATKSNDEIGKRKLSCSYDYTPVLEKGIFRGMQYDLKIINLKLDHVALVKEGRVENALIADSNFFKVKNTMKEFLKSALKGIFGLETINDSQIEQVMLLKDSAELKKHEEQHVKDKHKKHHAKDDEDMDDESQEEKDKEELEKIKQMEKHEKEEISHNKKAKDKHKKHHAKDNEKDCTDDEDDEEIHKKATLQDAINKEVAKQLKEIKKIQNLCTKAIGGKLSDNALDMTKEELIHDTLIKCGLNVENKNYDMQEVMLETLVHSNAINKNIKLNNINDNYVLSKNNYQYDIKELKKMMGDNNG